MFIYDTVQNISLSDAKIMVKHIVIYHFQMQNHGETYRTKSNFGITQFLKHVHSTTCMNDKGVFATDFFIVNIT